MKKLMIAAIAVLGFTMAGMAQPTPKKVDKKMQVVKKEEKKAPAQAITVSAPKQPLR